MLLMGGGYFLLDSSHITIMYADWGGEGRGYEAVQYNQSDLAIANSHGCSRAKVRAEVDKGLAYLDGKIEVLSD